MSLFEIQLLILVIMLYLNSRNLGAKLNQIAGRLKDIYDLMKANAPHQDENVPIKELCRRHRVQLEVAQANRRRR